jgi:hypothetical protein
MLHLRMRMRPHLMRQEIRVRWMESIVSLYEECETIDQQSAQMPVWTIEIATPNPCPFLP